MCTSLIVQSQVYPFLCDLQQPSGPNIPSFGYTITEWDWRTEDYRLYLKDRPGFIDVPSPWHPNGSDYPYNMGLYALGNPSTFDYQPSEGWELVYKSFGAPLQEVDHAFYVLTNRKNGITRGFFFIDNPGNDYNTLKILIKPQAAPLDRSSGVLKYSQEGDLLPLRNYVVREDDGFAQYNSAPPGKNYWAVIQFPTYYDPCTCVNSSGLQFQVDFERVTEVALSITGTSESEAIYEKGKPTKPVTALANGFGNIEKAYKLYSSLNNMTDALLKNSSDNATGSDNSKALSLLTSSLEYIPKVGGFISLVDQFFGGGKTSTPILMGYNTKYELEAIGRETTQYDPWQFAGKTPGSEQSDQIASRFDPIYDYPLGVFTMVELPKISMRTESEYEWPTGLVTTRKKFKFKSNSIQYTTNPMAGYNIKKGSLKAAIVFEVWAWTLDNSDLTTDATLPSSLPREYRTFTTPLINFECLEDYTVGIEEKLVQGAWGSYYTGQEFKSASLIVVLTGEDQAGTLTPITVGRYPFIVEDITSSSITIPDNPFQGLTPEQIEQSCNDPIIRPLSYWRLNRFCKDRYRPTILEASGLGEQITDKEVYRVSLEENIPKNEVNVNQKDLVVYPNPATNHITVDYHVDNYSSAEIQIYSVGGELVTSFSLSQNTLELGTHDIDITGMPSGLYALRLIQIDGSSAVTKFVIKDVK